MKKYLDSPKFQNLIELLKTYELYNSSFFRSNEYTRMIESIFDDLDQFIEIYNDAHQKHTDESNLLTENFHSDLNDISNKEKESNERDTNNFEQSLSSKEKEYNDKKDEIIKNYLDTTNSYTPAFKALNQEIEDNKNKIQKDFQDALYLLNEKLALYQQNILEIDKNNETLIMNKNNLKKINEETSLENVNNAKERANSYADELKATFDARKEDINHKIEQYKTDIANNTAYQNDKISEIHEEEEKKRLEKTVPYKEKVENIIKDELEMTSSFKEISNQVLEEFTFKMQSLDNEISELRDLERSYDDEYNKLTEDMYIEHVRNLNKRLAEYDIQINNIQNFIKNDYSDDLKKKQQAKKKLIKERMAISRIIQIEFEKKRKIKEKEYLEGKYNYAKELESLRSKKALHEVTKNGAFKNINLEQQVLTNKFALSKNLNSSLEKNFRQKDQLEENIKALEIRLNRDIDNNIQNKNINLARIEAKKDEFYLAQMIEKNNFDLEKELELIEEQRIYKNNALENDINHAKVTNLLYSQQEKMKEATEQKLYDKRIMHIKENEKFLKNTTDIQYNLNKLDIEYSSTKHDKDLKYIKDKLDIYKAYNKMSLEYRIKQNEIEKRKEENEKRAELYFNRFKIEEKIIKDAFDLLRKKMNRVINFENYILTNYAGSLKDGFNKSRETVTTLLNILSEYIDDVLIEYYYVKRQVLEDRVDYLTDIKYATMLEELTSSHQSSNDIMQKKIDKLEETINNYHNAIIKFEADNKKILEESKQNNYKRLDENNSSIFDNNEKIRINKQNISELTKSVNKHKQIMQKAEKEYQKQLSTIKRQEKNDSQHYKQYLDIFDLYKDLIFSKTKAFRNLVNSKVSYNSLVRTSNRLLIMNNNLIALVRILHDKSEVRLEHLINMEVSNLKRNYNDSYVHLKHHNISLINDENKHYEKQLIKLKKEYINEEKILKNKYEQDQRILLSKMKIETNNIVLENDSYNLDVAKINYELSTLISCSNDNILNYEEDLKRKEESLRKDYFGRLKAIEKKYNANLKDLENKRLAYEKHYKTQVNNFLNEKEMTDKTNHQQYKENLAKYQARIANLIVQDRLDERQTAINNIKIDVDFKAQIIKNRHSLNNQIASIHKKEPRKYAESKREIRRAIEQKKRQKEGSGIF